MKSTKSKTQRLTAFLGSNRFWVIIVCVFVFQSVWIALTARYPMAFDEQFHFGIIKLYAHHISPFWSGQPSGADQFGAVTRDPSYLYQYLMSFPYRLISSFISSETSQVIILRLLNIGIMLGALVVFRRVLAKVGASPKTRNVVLACLVLTPVTPFLAAQINYDSLMVLVTALAFNAYLGFRSALRETSIWRWDRLGRLTIICLFASLVKYAFLPIAGGLFIALVADWRYARSQKVKLVHEHHAKNMPYRALLYLVPILVGIGLFSERYVGNVISYHTPIPECNQVLSVAECQGYDPWARNYMYANWNVKLKHEQLVTYPFIWMRRALGETVFTITSRFNDQGTVDYYGAPQLLIPNILAWTMFVGGGLLAIYNWRAIKRNRMLAVVLGISGLYVLALFAQNFMDYLHLGFLVAIHGRYLLPVMPLLYLAVVLGVSRLIGVVSRTAYEADMRRTLLAAGILIIFAVEGGGFVTFIVRSRDDWFWPQSRPAQQVNRYVRDVLDYVVVR